MKVWKYPLVPAIHLRAELPKKAQILSVQMQYGAPTMWALVNEKVQGTTIRDFAFIGTGEDFPEGKDLNKWVFLDTVQIESLDEVYHVFETTGS